MAVIYKSRIPIQEMLIYERTGQAIQATSGGLILGRSHVEGGIYCWIKYENDYILEAEVEGYEFIINPGAAHHYRKIFNEFNKPSEHAHLPDPDYSPPRHITLLDARGINKPKHLLFDLGHFAVVNKKSTHGYLETLNEMNKAVTYKFITPNYAETVILNRDPIIKTFFDHEEGFF